MSRRKIMVASTLAVLLITAPAVALTEYDVTWTVTGTGTETWTTYTTSGRFVTQEGYEGETVYYLHPPSGYQAYGWGRESVSADHGWDNGTYLDTANNRLVIRVFTTWYWVVWPVWWRWGYYDASYLLYSKKSNNTATVTVTHTGSGTVNYGDGDKHVGTVSPPAPQHGGVVSGVTYSISDDTNCVDTWLTGTDVYAKVVDRRVTIDVKPGTDSNPINPDAKGVIPVAILTTADFDAATVDPATVEFGPNGATMVHKQAHLEDVDGDGDMDLLLHFNCEDTGIAAGHAEVLLTGTDYDGFHISGVDSIETVGGDE